MKTRMIIAGVLFILTTQISSAQRLGMELRPAASIATAKLGNTELKTGMGFDAMLNYNLAAGVSLYGGWGWNRFASDNATAQLDFEETGYMLGLRYTYSLPAAPMGIFVRAGGVYNHIEMENSEGEIISDSGHGFGWQTEAGVEISLGKGWKLRPGIKYQSLQRNLEIEDVSRDVSLTYLSPGIGIAYSF